MLALACVDVAVVVTASVARGVTIAGSIFDIVALELVLFRALIRDDEFAAARATHAVLSTAAVA